MEITQFQNDRLLVGLPVYGHLPLMGFCKLKIQIVLNAHCNQFNSINIHMIYEAICITCKRNFKKAHCVLPHHFVLLRITSIHHFEIQYLFQQTTYFFHQKQSTL